MRVAIAFILLISLALAFKLEKERLPFEDETDEQTDLQEQDEFDLNERGDHDEPKEREEQDENDGDSKLENLEEKLFGRNYCCTHVCFVTPPECITAFGRSFSGR